MRRFDAVLLLAVSVFAAFVGAQVFHATSARAAVHKKPVVVAAEPRARSASPATQQQPTIVGSDSSELRTMIVSSARPAPVRDEADIRLRMAAVASGTYMSDMLADLNGMLVRWPDRPGEPLRVWVQRTSDVPDWQAANTQTAENAFADWQHSGFPLRFDFVLDSTSADIRVLWTDRFPAEAGQRVGSTQRTSDQHGWIDRPVLFARGTDIVHEHDVRPPDLRARARALSGGNQQKLVLGRELATAPLLLLVAQPTRGVDIGGIERIHRTLVELRDRGCAILLVSSELEEVTALADRLLVMRAGSIVGEVDPRATTAEEIGLMMTGGRAAA